MSGTGNELFSPEPHSQCISKDIFWNILGFELIWSSNSHHQNSELISGRTHFSPTLKSLSFYRSPHRASFCGWIRLVSPHWDPHRKGPRRARRAGAAAGRHVGHRSQRRELRPRRREVRPSGSKGDVKFHIPTPGKLSSPPQEIETPKTSPGRSPAFFVCDRHYPGPAACSCRTATCGCRWARS